MFLSLTSYVTFIKSLNLLEVLHKRKVLQEEESLPESKSRLLSNAWKWIVPGDTRTDKEQAIGKGTFREQQEKGTQENSSVTWLAVSGFMVMGLVSGLSLANHSFF